MNLAGWVEKWGRAAGERTAIASATLRLRIPAMPPIKSA